MLCEGLEKGAESDGFEGRFTWCAHRSRIWRFLAVEIPTRQLTLTEFEYHAKKCPACGATLEIIEGHWVLRDCALCAWCRRWFALPRAKENVEGLGEFHQIAVTGTGCAECGGAPGAHAPNCQWRGGN
jgi:hypothetical protein